MGLAVARPRCQAGGMETSVSRQSGPDRFVVEADGIAAGFAQFHDHDGHRIFFHTVVSAEFSGHGLANLVIERALTATRDEGLRIVAVCPLVKQYVERHADEWGASVDRATPAMLQALPPKL
ncbi:putative GNAT family acetyltransferase [Agrococcus sp. UYP33]